MKKHLPSTVYAVSYIECRIPGMAQYFTFVYVIISKNY